MVICGRDAGRIEEAAQRIGPSCTGIVHDVGDAAGGAGFVAAAREVLGEVDIVVANGGGPPGGTFESTPVGAYDAALDLSLLSVVGMAKAAVPRMRERRWGRFVAITSLSVRQPIPTLILSNTARAGTTGFLTTVAREVAADGVTVNSVQPGLHRTARVTDLYGDATDALAGSIPAGRLGDADDFGAVVAFLCSVQAGYITGAHVHVDGGAFAGLQ